MPAQINYAEYINGRAWRERAEVCKQRAGYRCQVCNRSRADGARLEAHHRTYENFGSEQPGDLTCLCEECHGLFSRHRRLPCYRCGIIQSIKALWGGA